MVLESTESWRALLWEWKAHWLAAPAKLAVGDGALAYWAALEEVYPATRQQRCWVRKKANVLNCLPRSAQPKAKSMLHEIWMAEARANAERAFDRFIDDYCAKYPKATDCLAKVRATLQAFFDFPAAHWIHIRTTKPIESTFATIRHRTDRSMGCLSRATLMGLTFKLAMSTEQTWCRLRDFERLSEVVAGVKFIDGMRQEKQRHTKLQLQQAAD